MRAFVLIFLGLLAVSFGYESFEGHKVLRIHADKIEELDFLAHLFYTNNTLDFWIEPKHLQQKIDIRITPEQVDWLVGELNARKMIYSVMIENVEELVRNQLKDVNSKPMGVGIDYTKYHTYEDIIDWVKTIPAAYPHIATVVNLGKSYQGRELLAVRISSNKTTNKAVWFDGGLHAREWITTATVVYMLGNILNDYGTDPTITSLVDGGEIWAMPVFNTDGYAYTFSNDRMWRKTRSTNQNSNCIGTDPNRNWDYKWGEAGASNDPCSDIYQGAVPFSEVEPRTVGNFIRNYKKFNGYINFHSYSQLWMSPWGYTSDYPKDYDAQNKLGGRCVDALKKVSGTEYQYGTISNIIYPASGSSADFTYGTSNTIYSYGVELRDTGTYGFLLPADQIVPSGKETYEAVKVWALQSLAS